LPRQGAAGFVGVALFTVLEIRPVAPAGPGDVPMFQPRDRAWGLAGLFALICGLGNNALPGGAGGRRLRCRPTDEIFATGGGGANDPHAMTDPPLI